MSDVSEGKAPMIYSAVCGVMEDVGVVGKGDYNKSQGFKYRSIDAVMNAINPAMIKHKIFCAPEVMEQTREERVTSKGGNLIYSVCKIRYRFYTIDGSYVDVIVVGEGMDSGDKATNKAMAAAFKYACFQTFCIPTEHLMDDPDAETPDASRRSNSSQDNERKSLMDTLAKELVRAGYGWNNVFVTYKVDSMDKLTIQQIKDCISKMKRQPDKDIPC